MLQFETTVCKVEFGCDLAEDWKVQSFPNFESAALHLLMYQHKDWRKIIIVKQNGEMQFTIERINSDWVVQSLQKDFDECQLKVRKERV